MLDELANKYQRDAASHQEKLRQMEEEQEAEVKSLQEKLTQEHVCILVLTQEPVCIFILTSCMYE